MYDRVNALTTKWWFYALLLVVFFMPSYAAQGVDPAETFKLVQTVLSSPLVRDYPMLMVVSKIAAAVVIGAMFALREKTCRLFAFFAAGVFFIIALLQNLAFTEQYGTVFLTGNALITLVVAYFWGLETFVQRNAIRAAGMNNRELWMLPLAILAFWFPVDPSTVAPHFALNYLWCNESVLTFCMITPVIIAVTMLLHNRINLPVLRVTSFVGTLFGVINTVAWFVVDGSMWWMGMLHLPLLLISARALWLTTARRPASVHNGKLGA